MQPSVSAPESNQIPVRQDEDKFVQRVAAFRRLYTEYKRWMTVWWISAVVVAILGTGFFALTQLQSAVVLFIAVVLLALQVMVLPWIDAKRVDAALVQELFDRELFDLRWNKALAYPPVETDIVKPAAARFWQKASEAEKAKTKGWYEGVEVDQPLLAARLYCQEQNLWWSESDNRAYFNLLVIVFVLAVLVLGAIALVANFTIQDFLNGPILLCLPLIGFLVNYLREHRKTVENVSRLKLVVAAALEDAREKRRGITELTQDAYDLQNEIYYHRRNSAPVPDRFYQWRDRRRRQQNAQS